MLDFKMVSFLLKLVHCVSLLLKPVTHGSTFVDQQMLQLLFNKGMNSVSCRVEC